MAIKTVKKYAMTVTDQYNENIKNRTHWDKPENAIGHTDAYTTATFTKEKYATHYKTEYVKDKNGKEVAKKVADKWGYKYTHPATISAHDFRLELPDDAKIRNIKFRCRMTANKNDIHIPRCRFNIYSKNNQFDNTQTFSTGWNNGIYYDIRAGNIDTSFHTYVFEMDKTAISEGKVNNLDASWFNKDIFGIDFEFYDAFTNTPKDKLDGTVRIKWVELELEYEVPSYTFKLESEFDNQPVANLRNLGLTNQQTVVVSKGSQVTTKFGTESNPLPVNANDTFQLTGWLENPTSITNGSTTANFTFEDGTTVTVPFHHGTYSNGAWTTDLTAKNKKKIQFNLTSKRTGLNVVTTTIDDRTYKYYYYVYAVKEIDGYSNIKITTPSDLHHRHKACLSISLDGYSTDEWVTISVSNINHFTYSSLTLDTSASMNVESISNVSSSGCTVKLADAGDYRLTLNYCGYPIVNASTGGECGLTVTNQDDPTQSASATFTVKPAYTYVISNKENTEPNMLDLYPQYCTVTNHRVTSIVDMNAVNIEAISVDRDMVMGDCTLSMDIWEDLDYIGCIPLEQTHFNPKSTYKDTLLDTHYKNKRYMGKKLATDEDITLNVRLHPQEVTTLQGLIAMDKPIPINANHKCFEGDALNHRGWAEIYGVKVEQTGNNPHWYKCDIDVKYLTHNLNTRFKINRGTDVPDYSIPPLLVETFSSGENLSYNLNPLTDYDDDPTNDNDPYFDVDTDGTFHYDSEKVTLTEEFTDDNDDTITNTGSLTTYTFELGGVEHSIVGIDDVVDFLQTYGYDIVTPVLNETLKYQNVVTVPEYERNNFNIDNGQHIRVTTHNKLTHNAVIDFTWSSAIIEEYRENAVKRVIRLLDKDKKNPVFEYQYDALKFTSDGVTGNYICRIYNENGTWFDKQGTLSFRYNPSDIATDEDVSTDTTDVINSTGVANFGTTTTLTIRDGKVSLRDSGFNGREVAIDGFKLVGGEYYYQVEWSNENSDDETSDIDCLFDFRVQDTVLTTKYADKWGNLIVSPFPVSDKQILFTRQAEEGTIYYYFDDAEEFSYLVEPYWQYLNGTDLVTSDGISTVNLLNYGYEIVYIQNGLVRLGFNRITGELFLGKWNPNIESYTTVSRMHLLKFDDINLNSITDDKIEVQASDSVFTIWRGHPYIKVKHELEDIIIDTQYNSVWAEQVGNRNAVELPAYWDLMNTKNLLPASVGGNTTVDADAIEVDSVYINDRIQTTLAFSNPASSTYTDTDVTFTITDGNGISNYSDYVDLDDQVCSFGTVEWSETCDSSTPTAIASLSFTKNIIQTGDGIDISASVTNPCNIGVDDVRVDFYEVFEPTISLTSDKNIIQSGSKAQLSATVKDDDGSLVKDTRVDFYEVYTPQYIGFASNKSVMQVGDTADLSVKIKDATDGNIVKGATVYFYEKYEPVYNFTSNKSVIQTGEVADLSVKLKDTDGNIVKGETVYFYERVDD